MKNKDSINISNQKMEVGINNSHGDSYPLFPNSGKCSLPQRGDKSWIKKIDARRSLQEHWFTRGYKKILSFFT
jgi:hypothetical protein